MREPVRKVIDGEEYTFCQLPVKQSIRLLTRIIKFIGPSLGIGIHGEGIRSIADIEIDPGAIISNLCSRIDEQEIEYIIDALLSQVLHNGKGNLQQVFDAHFGGRIPHLFKVVAAALEVNYGDFLGGVLEKIKENFRAAMIQEQLM
jgi:hypothetical protein